MNFLPNFQIVARRAAVVSMLACVSVAAAVDLKPDSAIPPASPLSGPSLTERLARGGLVIYVRHERTTREPVERFASTVQPGCERDNTVSRAGGDRAIANRHAITLLKLPIGRVFSSPYCRSTETAALMFGKPELTAQLDSVHAAANRTPEQMRLDAVALINKEAMAGKNLVLVGHREGIMALTGADLNTGDAVILEPVAGGLPRVVGFVSNLRWTQLASDAARREAMARASAAR